MKREIWTITLILVFSTSTLFSGNQNLNFKKPLGFLYSKSRISIDLKKVELITKIHHQTFLDLEVKKNLIISESEIIDDISSTMNILTNQDVIRINNSNNIKKITLTGIYGEPVIFDQTIMKANPLLINIANIKKGIFIITCQKDDGSIILINLLKY